LQGLLQFLEGGSCLRCKKDCKTCGAKTIGIVYPFYFILG
jgi:hypothetical protein